MTTTKRKAPVQLVVSTDVNLTAIIGSEPIARTEATKRLWDYIKREGLQDPENKRMIQGDERLGPIFGKPKVSMFEMTALISKHLKKV